MASGFSRRTGDVRAAESLVSSLVASGFGRWSPDSLVSSFVASGFSRTLRGRASRRALSLTRHQAPSVATHAIISPCTRRRPLCELKPALTISTPPSTPSRASTLCSSSHRYDRGDDREVVALCAAALAFGRVASVMQSIAALLAVMGRRPASVRPRLRSRAGTAILLASADSSLDQRLRTSPR